MPPAGGLRRVEPLQGGGVGAGAVLDADDRSLGRQRDRQRAAEIRDLVAQSVSDRLGRVKTITIDKDSTTLIEGAGKKGDIQARVKQIRSQIEETTSDGVSPGSSVRSTSSV